MQGVALGGQRRGRVAQAQPAVAKLQQAVGRPDQLAAGAVVNPPLQRAVLAGQQAEQALRRGADLQQRVLGGDVRVIQADFAIQAAADAQAGRAVVAGVHGEGLAHMVAVHHIHKSKQAAHRACPFLP